MRAAGGAAPATTAATAMGTTTATSAKAVTKPVMMMTGHTTLSGQQDRGSAPLLLPLLPLLSVGGTVPLICAHP